MSRNQGDKGILLYLHGIAAGRDTYKDSTGATVTAQQLAVTYVAGESFYVGAADALLAAVKNVFAGGTTKITVKAEMKRRDENNPTIFGWMPFQTVRSDTGVQDFQHEFLAADPLVVAGVLEIALQTTGHRLGGEFRISAKADVLADGSKCIVGVNV